MIHAPFNFVPLSDKVFFPDWADQISQDIPFEDGLSGTIDIELKAVTPMFVRNGHTKEQGEEETEEYCKFSTSPDGRLFIPATTIKGTIRNAVEILSFGKMSHMNNKRYAMRKKTNTYLNRYLYDDHKQDKKKDLAECIFGTTDGTSLKGRVMFSHAFCKEGHLEPEQKVYMASPKPTYYPIYLKQQGECGFMEVNDKIVSYKTLLDSDAELKGWKKYPIRNEATSNLDATIPDGQNKNSNPFRPVASGSIFSGSVVFHNLKKFELAALVYGLELKNEALHSIGFAKPYGYGATKITVNKITGCDLSVDELRQYYEDCMEKEIPNYKTRNEIKEFFCMSKSQTLMTGYSLSYMTLDEFVKGKLQHKNNDRKHNAGNYLPYYSEMLEQPKKQQKPLVPIEATAKVTYDRRGSYEAALLNGKDTSAKKLDLKYSKDKLRMGDIIVVEIIQNAGRISSLVYKHKA